MESYQRCDHAIITLHTSTQFMNTSRTDELNYLGVRENPMVARDSCKSLNALITMVRKRMIFIADR